SVSWRRPPMRIGEPSALRPFAQGRESRRFDDVAVARTAPRRRGAPGHHRRFGKVGWHATRRELTSTLCFAGAILYCACSSFCSGLLLLPCRGLLKTTRRWIPAVAIVAAGRRTRFCVLRQESLYNGYRYREVLQHPEGLWLHHSQ